ncbi:MAG: PDZ domain-containing protein [Isosphaerales bacterium]
MVSHIWGGGTPPLRAFALAFGVWVLFDSSVAADDYGVVVTEQGPKDQKARKGDQVHGDSSYGTLGYGAPGLYPGFQGFGLGYHLGYGYGGDALGVGAEGGFPFYAGPGYPHAEPTLRRIGGITPFPYYGGPGYPTPDHPNFFGGCGPLVPDQPVVTIATESGEPIGATDFGPFTGAVPDPEALFAPFVSRAAARASSAGAGPSYPTAIPTIPVPTTPPPGASIPSTPPATSRPSSSSAVGRSLGIEEVPVVDANGARGIKISNVYSGAAAEKAGLHAGDVVYSSNGYLTQVRGNLPWIINHAAPSKVLTMRVRTVGDSTEHTITAQLP